MLLAENRCLYVYMDILVLLENCICMCFCLLLFALDVRIRSDAWTMGLRAMLWKNRNVNFFCFIKRRTTEYYIPILSKESLLQRFAVNRLSASGLTLAVNCLFLFYVIYIIDFVKLKNLPSKERILEAKTLYL